MRKHILNYFYIFILQCGNYVFPLITLPIVSRVFGPRLIGEYNYAGLIIGYACLLISYGFNYTGVRRLSKNKGEKNKIFFTILYCQALFLLLSTIFFIFIFLYSGFDKSLKILLFICYFSCVSTIFQQSWIFQVYNDFRIITIVSLLTKAVSLFLILFLIKSKSDLYLYAFIIQGAMLFSSIISFFIAIKKYGLFFCRIQIKELLIFYKEDFYIFSANVLGNLYTSTSIVILGFMTNSYNVGIYSTAQKIIDLLVNFSLLPLNMLLLPLLSETFGRNKKSGIELVNKLFPLFILICALAVFFTLIMGKYIIIFGFGTDFLPALKVLNVLVFGFIFVFFGYIIGGQVILNLGYDKSFVSIQVIIASLSIFMNFVLLRNGDAIQTAYIWSFCEFLMTSSQFIFLYIKKIKVVDWGCFRMIELKNNLKLITKK